MKKQIVGDKLCELVSKRKKLPHRALDMWKYNRMRQKNIFSEPLVHGMCTNLHNTYRAEFPRILQEANAEIPQKVTAQIPREVAAQIPREVAPFDLNEIAQEVARIAQEEAAQEAAAAQIALEAAQEVAPFDLNEIAPEAAAQEEDAQDMDVQEEAAQDMDAQDLEAQKEADAQEHPKAELTNQQRHGVYFALEVIRTRDGGIQATDKYLIASMLDTSVRTLELKPVTVTHDVMREFICKKVIPAIQDRWPDEDVGRTILIQQDNAKPHLLPTDDAFRRVMDETDLDIKLIQQPPNSPDMNVLDLCFFRSLQSHTDSRAPTTIKELIEGVEEEYSNYDVQKLARSFMTLQYCMIEAMKVEGGIGYELPHKHKERAEGELPFITADLLAKTKALIEGEVEK